MTARIAPAPRGSPDGDNLSQRVEERLTFDDRAVRSTYDETRSPPRNVTSREWSEGARSKRRREGSHDSSDDDARRPHDSFSSRGGGDHDSRRNDSPATSDDRAPSQSPVPRRTKRSSRERDASPRSDNRSRRYSSVSGGRRGGSKARESRGDASSGESEKRGDSGSRRGSLGDRRRRDHSNDSHYRRHRYLSRERRSSHADDDDYYGHSERRRGSRRDSRSRSPRRGSNFTGKSKEEDTRAERSDPQPSTQSAEAPPAETAAQKRRRRTGWDSQANAASSPHGAGLAAASLVSVGGMPATLLTPTSTGFTASLAGKTPEQIQAELAERQAQAAVIASGMQAKASAHHLCRIYVGSLDYSLTDADIRQVFSAFGPIVNIDMPKEGNRSKGFCFVEYSSPESAEMALQTMPGFNLKGRAIKVGRPTALGGQQVIVTSPVPVTLAARPAGVNAAEAGQMAAAMLLAKGEAGAPSSTPPAGSTPLNIPESQNRVYVGSVPYQFTADDIRQIFEVFGTILSCQLIPSNERPGTHRGYGFIEYSKFSEAKLAIETMNDFQVAGKVLKVNYATALRAPNSPAMLAGVLAGSSSFNVNEMMTAAGGSLGSMALGAGLMPFTPASPLSSNLALTGSTGVLNTKTAQVIPALQQHAAANGSTESPVLLLCNMVDPDEANNELREEIRQECSKHGSISNIEIVTDRTRGQVRIFVVFELPADAARAMPLLHDRWFGGRKIEARIYDHQAFLMQRFWN